MKINDLAKMLSWQEYFIAEQAEITEAYTSDLLSDVMAHAAADSILITIQAHKNTIAVSSLLGIKAVLFCNGRTADQETLDSARQEGISVLGTQDDQYTSSWKIHQALSQ